MERLPKPIDERIDEVKDIASIAAERVYNKFALRFETDASTVHRDRYCGYIIPDFRTVLTQ